MDNNSLVEEDDVREPDVLRGNVEHVHAAVLAGVPPQLVVDPLLQITYSDSFNLFSLRGQTWARKTNTVNLLNDFNNIM